MVEVKKGRCSAEDGFETIRKLRASGRDVFFEGHSISYVNVDEEKIDLFIKRYYLKSCYKEACSNSSRYCTECTKGYDYYSENECGEEEVTNENDTNLKPVMINYETFYKKVVQYINVTNEGDYIRFQMFYGNGVESYSIRVSCN